ncbi:unnamed protein product [Closterium sp. Naga37s-1]|nr:unnamed protein product [Closterium sp. Naga37s-1]
MEVRSIAAAVLASSPLPPRGAVSRQGVEIARPAEMQALLGTRAAAASSAARAERCASSGAASSAVSGASSRAISSTTAGHRRATNRTEGAREARPVVSRKKRRGLRRVAHLSAGDGAQPSPESARAVCAEVLIVGPLHSTRGDEEGGDSAQGVAGEASCAGGGAQQEGLGARGDGLAGQGGVWTEADEAELIARAVGGAVGGAVVNAGGALIAGVTCAGAGDAEGAEAAWERLGAEGSAGVSLAGEAEAEGEGGEFEMARGRLELERAQLELAMRESRGEAERREAERGAAESGEAEEGEAESGGPEAVDGALAAGEAELRETTGLGEGARNGEGSVCTSDTVGLLVARKGPAGVTERAERQGRADAAWGGESSDDEAAAVEARPAAFPAALNSLYLAFVFNCFVEHAWRFTGAALLALLHDSLLPVAVASFAGQLVVFVGAPLVGDMMDSAPRVAAFNTISCIQTAAMVAAALATLTAVHAAPAAAGQTGAALMRKGWFVVLVLAGAVERITGIASGVAFERDWVILLAGQDNAAALANANAMLRRADLFCDVAGPLVFGWLLSAFSPAVCIKASLATMLLSLPILICLVLLTDRQSNGVLSRPKPPTTPQVSLETSSTHTSSSSSSREMKRIHASTRSPSPAASIPPPMLLLTAAAKAVAAALTGSLRAAVSVLGMSFRSVVRGWRSFLGQPVLAVSVAYVLLFFNCVLSPGGLITSFLTHQGVDVVVIGAFRGACAAMGFAATFLSPLLITRLGLLQAGGAALLFQSLVLAASLGVFALSHSMGHHHSLLLAFLALIVVSRLGHWTYDVVDAQIFQVAIPPAQANIVGTTEVALASLAELVMLALAIAAHDVRHFGLLAALSAAAVFAAAGIYCTWERSGNHHRRSLFPPEPRLRWPWGRRKRRGGRAGGGRGAGTGAPAAPAA